MVYVGAFKYTSRPGWSWDTIIVQVNNAKNIYSTTPGALSSPPCAVGLPEEAPGKRQQYKRARVLDQYRQVRIVTLPTNAGKLEKSKKEKKNVSFIVRLES